MSPGHGAPSPESRRVQELEWLLAEEKRATTDVLTDAKKEIESLLAHQKGTNLRGFEL